MVDDWASLLELGTHFPDVHLLFYNFLKDDKSFLLEAERELMKMASCCQKCGVTGYEELLVYCRKCRISAEHRYCLDKLPKNTDNVHWFCEQCDPTPSNIDSLEELRIEFDSCPSTSSEQDGGRTSKRRRLILAAEDNLDQEQELQPGCGKQNVSKKATLPSSEPELQSDCGDQDGRKKTAVPSSEPELQSDCGDRNGSKKATMPSSERDLQSHRGDQNGSKKAIASFSESELQSHWDDQNDNKKATVPSSEPELQSHHVDHNVSKEVTGPSSEPELHSDCGGQNVVNKATMPSSEPVLSLPALHANSFNEVMIGSRIVALKRSASQATVQEEVNLCSVARPIFHQNVSNKDIVPSSESVLALPMPHTSSSDDGRIDSRIAVQETSAFQAMVQEEVDASAVARPFSEHVWRGYISFGDEMYGPLRGHLSTRACSKVCNIVKSLPLVLHMEKLSRLDSWPNSYKRSPPTVDQIGLYFFPALTMVEPVFDQLLDDAIQKDLAFKLVLDEAELLIFYSTLLPKDDDRFFGKYFLWGAFRGRRVPVNTSSADHHTMPSELKEENGGDKEEGEGRDEGSSDSQINNYAFSPLSVLQPPKSNGLTEETQISEGLSKRVEPNKGSEAKDEEPCDDLEEGEIRDEHVERGEEEIFEEGEIRDEHVERGEEEIFEGFGQGHCLELFPLAVEDMGIVSRVGGSDKELNLELGLSRQSAGHNDGRRAVLKSFL